MGMELKNRLLAVLRNKKAENHAKSADSNTAATEEKLAPSIVIPPPDKEKLQKLGAEPVSITVHVDEWNDDDIPIFATTAGQLRAWHIIGENFPPLWRYLHEFDRSTYLSYLDYRFFNVGYNRAEHFAAFALDDTHYYRIQFDATDTYAVDPYEFRILSRLRKISMQLFAAVKFEMVIEKRELEET